ncbi:hypothetical protein LINPERPRIM_LOCUS43478 [Linum perenne]
MSSALNLVSVTALSLFLLAAVTSARTTVILEENCTPAAEATLWHCQEYMKEEAVVRNGVATGLTRRDVDLKARDVDLKMCCFKLEQMETAAEGSTCSGVEDAMKGLVAEQKMRGEVIMGGEELRNAWSIAAELPRKCGVVNSPAKCRFSSRLSANSFWST